MAYLSTTDVSLYFLSLLSQAYNINIDRGTSVPGYVREVFNRLNATEKRLFFI